MKAKSTGQHKGTSPSRLIDGRIKELDDWRGAMLSRLRGLIKEADPDVVEEWKWRGVPVWEHDGIICTGETYKSVGWRWLKFLVDLTKPERVIVINHDDCRWYFSLLRAHDPEFVRSRQLGDLREIQRELGDRFAGQIEAYYARIEKGVATFERVTP